MKVKKIMISLLKEDILKFFSFQKKIIVSDLIIDNNLNIKGAYNLKGININFESMLEISKVEHNNVFGSVIDFKLLKMNIFNVLSKKAFSYVSNAFENIDGISFQGQDFKIEITKIIDRYYKEQTLLKLDNVVVNKVVINKGEVEISFSDIDINTSISERLSQDNHVNKDAEIKDISYIETEVINDAMEEIAFTAEEIKDYKNNFNEDSFFNKIKNYSRNAGISTIYAALILYYTYKDKSVPITVKVVALGALGYFILPTDVIPDFAMIVGYSDDIVALITAIKSIKAYINDDIRLKAKTRLKEWFDNINEKELEKIDAYL